MVSHNYKKQLKDLNLPSSSSLCLIIRIHLSLVICVIVIGGMVREVEFLHFVLFSFKSLFRKITRTILIHSLPFLFFLMGKFVNEGSGVEILIPINSEM